VSLPIIFFINFNSYRFNMDYLKNILALAHRKTKRSSVQKSNAQQSSPLAKLPVELLLEILGLLPLESAVAFTLTSQLYYSLFGSEHFGKLAPLCKEKLAFLELLDHDLEDYIFCSYCKVFHKIKHAKRYTLDQPQTCQQVVLDKEVRKFRLYISSNFSRTIFKMAMKHFRYFGNDDRTRQLLRLLSTGRDRTAYPLDSYSKFREETDFRIKDASLFMSKRITYRGRDRYFRGDMRLFLICPHLESCSHRQVDGICITIDSHQPREMWSTIIELDTGHNNKGQRSSGLHRCQYCPTEYKVEIKYGKGVVFSVTCTIWKDLGKGPDTEEWKAHCDPKPPVPDVEIQAGWIAAVFAEA
jgi:hypothetical protein